MQVTKVKKDQSPLTFNFLGRWRNQHGSEMNILAIDNGKVIGTFKTGVGAHQPDEELELTGYVSGNLITFTVNFGKYHTLTAWTGQHARSSGQDKIETMWHLARMLPENSENDNLWAGIWTGADTFSKVMEEHPRNLEMFDRPPFVPSYPIRISRK